MAVVHSFVIEAGIKNLFSWWLINVVSPVGLDKTTPTCAVLMDSLDRKDDSALSNNFS
jgi:hypothetical protein